MKHTTETDQARADIIRNKSVILPKVLKRVITKKPTDVMKKLKFVVRATSGNTALDDSGGLS